MYSASKGALELITEALRMEVQSFGITITNIAPGDFATNIARGRYHAPIIKGSDYELVYGNILQAMNEHVDSGSNPSKWQKQFTKLSKRLHQKYIIKLGLLCKSFLLF